MKNTLGAIYKRRLHKRENLVTVTVTQNMQRDLICANCKTMFPDDLARCPECGSTEWAGLVEVNPYTHLPMENLLKVCGHCIWLMGTIGFLTMLWNADSTNPEINLFYIYGAITLLICGVLFSVAYFGLGELLQRTRRVQQRLRAFHKNYRDKKQSG